MPTLLNTKTKDTPLKFAKQLTALVNNEWENGTFIEKVTPITKDLLKYWFKEPFTQRHINFHLGQKQAILNTVYCHEILKCDSTLSLYQQASEGLLSADFLNAISDEKYKYPKYCVKMATGTGKTWVMNALLIWQYLNAKFTENADIKFTKNFLIVAPGLIVYERLLDAFLGKEVELSKRDFKTADIVKNVDLFIPEQYKNTVFSFIQNNVKRKEDIGSVTGDGLIAITNWHALIQDKSDEEEDDELEVSPLSNPSKTVKELMPITPGVTAGHDLNTLDNFGNNVLEYLKNLKDICVFNDEAHHIHENKTAGIVNEVEWQKSLNYISSEKGKSFIQIDFSATPYDVTGSGQKRTKHYFAHIIVDFDLKTAIREGLVKIIALDKRQEIASLENEDIFTIDKNGNKIIDFKAIREGGEVLELSKGQKLLLRAGKAKLERLEEEFTKIDSDKHPKMLVVCEDTKVTPLVIDFLKQEGLSDDDIMQIDSDKKGSIKEGEWKEVKQRLFNLDKHNKPKVIVSVLMLREGFDVNNVCVIVPLRSSQAPILLEQLIGRGLRLMWREEVYQDIKQKNIKRLLDEKVKPEGYYDILSIVEHPAFKQFYEDLEEGLYFEEKEMPERKAILGDIIEVGLKEDYQKYDFYIPVILQDKEEILTQAQLDPSKLEPFPWSLEQMKNSIPKEDGEIFYSEELTVKTTFGEYKVNADRFSANNYNEFLVKLMNCVLNNLKKVGIRGNKTYPFMQINQAYLIQLIDDYIRHYLFNTDFNPLIDNNWRVLMISSKRIVEHIMKQVSELIDDMQNSVSIEEARVQKEYFSQVDKIKMRENFSIDITKSIYQKTDYPSNKGEFEKDFLMYCDRSSDVERLIKIKENYHHFASLRYIRTDGLLSNYYPDFLVKIEDNIYVVETKSEKDKNDENVKQKQRGALDWCKKINELNENNRMNSTWHYVILDDTTFYAMKDRISSAQNLLKYCKITNAKIEGKLF